MTLPSGYTEVVAGSPTRAGAQQRAGKLRTKIAGNISILPDLIKHMINERWTNPLHHIDHGSEGSWKVTFRDLDIGVKEYGCYHTLLEAIAKRDQIITKYCETLLKEKQ